MKLPVPDDWNGQKWISVCIDWPDSHAYKAMLLGFMTYLTRGRAYDEETGTITEAQAVGEQIFKRNYPLRECGTDNNFPTPPIDLWPECGFGCADDECGECDEMACITDMKIENGKLYVMYGCCEWTEIGDLSEEMGDLGDAPFEDNNPDPLPTYSGCGKAAALIDVLWTVGNSGIDHYTLAPWNFIHALESDAGYNLNDVNCINIQLQAVIIEALGGVTGLFDPDVKQTLICKIAGWLNADATGLNSDTFNAITRLIQTMDFGDFVDNVVAQNYWVLCWWAIGKNNANNIAKMGATTIDADCDCPEQAAPRPDADSVLYDVLAELAPDNASTNNLNLQATNAQVHLWNTANGEENKLVRVDDIDVDMNVAVVEGSFYVYMRPSAAVIHPSTEWWIELELNLHWDTSDTTLTARFENPIPGSYQRVVVDCPHTGALTSINIEGHGWYNAHEANSLTVADWYITSGIPD